VPRFVVLKHVAATGTHWDFMLETREALATWSLAEEPDSAPLVPAHALPDHRMAYLDYEGPISEGRGFVTQWDHGTFQLEKYDRDEVAALVAGEKLLGQVTLRRSAESPERWIFSFTPVA
jgi:hypothetical protein